MSAPIPRYDLEWDHTGYSGYRDLVERPDGDYLRWDDHAERIAQLESSLTTTGTLLDRATANNDALRAEIARLEAENKSLSAMLEAQEQKYKECPHSVRENGPCACSYDRPSDVCEVHAPRVKQLEADLCAAREAQWTQDVPTEQGWYWHWDGVADVPFIHSVLWSGTNGKCFVSMAFQHSAPWCEDYGGWWLRIGTPALPDAALAQKGRTA